MEKSGYSQIMSYSNMIHEFYFNTSKPTIFVIQNFKIILKSSYLSKVSMIFDFFLRSCKILIKSKSYFEQIILHANFRMRTSAVLKRIAETQFFSATNVQINKFLKKLAILQIQLDYKKQTLYTIGASSGWMQWLFNNACVLLR